MESTSWVYWPLVLGNYKYSAIFVFVCHSSKCSLHFYIADFRRQRKAAIFFIRHSERYSKNAFWTTRRSLTAFCYSWLCRCRSTGCRCIFFQSVVYVAVILVCPRDNVLGAFRSRTWLWTSKLQQIWVAESFGWSHNTHVNPRTLPPMAYISQKAS